MMPGHSFTEQQVKELETLSKDAQQPFAVRGKALEILTEKAVYRDSHPSLEDYSKRQLGLSVERVRQLISAYQTLARLKGSTLAGGVLPANESQIRPLTIVLPERQVETWQYILDHTPAGELKIGFIRDVCRRVAAAPHAPIHVLTITDVPSAPWPSENDLDIPLLSLRLQAQYCDVPFECWGGKQRSIMAATWHFYTSDERFEGLIADPTPIPNSCCINAVEPNFTVYGQMPRVLALQKIYQKRWIARFWQSVGVRIFVDLNVHPLYYEDNLLGVPPGWKAYATRGYNERLDDTIREFDLACQRAGTSEIMFVVYGGRQAVKRTAKERGWLWFPEESDVRKGRSIADE